MIGVVKLIVENILIKIEGVKSNEAKKEAKENCAYGLKEGIPMKLEGSK